MLWSFVAIASCLQHCLLAMDSAKPVPNADLEYEVDDQIFFQKLTNCNRTAEKLTIDLCNDPEKDQANALLLAQCRAAHLYCVLGGDINKPPPHLGSTIFLQALEASSIPERLKTLTGEQVVDFTAEAQQLFRETKLAHQPRCRQIDLVSPVMNSKDFFSSALEDPDSRGFALEVASQFPAMFKISGDGNCFYRAFLFGLIHFFHKVEGGPSLEHRQQIMKIFEASSPLWEGHPVQQVGLDLIKTALENAPLFPMEFWHALCNRHNASDAMVYALRGITAHYANNDEHRAFIDEDFDDFVQGKIMCLGAWGGQIEASVLAQVFGVHLTITDLVALRRISSQEAPLDIADIEVIFNGVHYDLFFLN